jgi:hypothetical protein
MVRVSVSSLAIAKWPRPRTAAAEANAVRRHKLNLEGEEREYDEDQLRANFLKGRNAAQIITKADQRLKAAQEKEAKASELPKKLKENARLEALPKKKASAVNIKSRDTQRSPTEPSGANLEDALKQNLAAIKARVS